VAEGDELAQKAIAAWPGFITKRQCATAPGQPRDQLLDVIRPVEKIAELQHLAAAPASATATAIVSLWTSRPTKMVSFIRLVPPCLRLGAGKPGAILD